MKLGIIGLGRRMGAFLECLRKAAPELVVSGIVDQNPENARSGLSEKERESVVIYESLKDLVERGRPDALAIGTRCDSHARFATEAARYDLPLFLEKPVATHMQQAQELESAFQKSRCSVLVSFPLRASILCRRAKYFLDQGVVGDPEHFLAVNYVPYGHRYFETKYREYSVTQGMFLQKATHDFDYLAFLAGSPIVRVAATSSCGRIYRDSKTRGNHPSESSAYLDHIGTPATGMNEDSSSALLEFANGGRAVYTQVFYARRTPRRGVAISGYKGLLEFDWYGNQIKMTHHHDPFDDVSTVNGAENHFGGDAKLAENFIAMIREGASSLAPIHAGLESAYACLAAKESAERGVFVDVRQLIIQNTAKKH